MTWSRGSYRGEYCASGVRPLITAQAFCSSSRRFGAVPASTAGPMRCSAGVRWGHTTLRGVHVPTPGLLPVRIIVAPRHRSSAERFPLGHGAAAGSLDPPDSAAGLLLRRCRGCSTSVPVRDDDATRAREHQPDDDGVAPDHEDLGDFAQGPGHEWIHPASRGSLHRGHENRDRPRPGLQPPQVRQLHLSAQPPRLGRVRNTGGVRISSFRRGVLRLARSGQLRGRGSAVLEEPDLPPHGLGYRGQHTAGIGLDRRGCAVLGAIPRTRRPGADPHPYSNAYRCSDTDTDGHSGADADAHPCSLTETDSHSGADTDSYSVAHSAPDSDPDICTITIPDAHPGANPFNTSTSADPDAHPSADLRTVTGSVPHLRSGLYEWLGHAVLA
jgi:hypothetical protein